MTELRYYRVEDEGHHELMASCGGPPTYWVEVAPAGDASREIVCYPGGLVFCLSEDEPENTYHSLSVTVVDGDDQWWEPHRISASDFEAEWRRHNFAG